MFRSLKRPLRFLLSNHSIRSTVSQSALFSAAVSGLELATVWAFVRLMAAIHSPSFSQSEIGWALMAVLIPLAAKTVASAFSSRRQTQALLAVTGEVRNLLMDAYCALSSEGIARAHKGTVANLLGEGAEIIADAALAFAGFFISLVSALAIGVLLWRENFILTLEVAALASLTIALSTWLNKGIVKFSREALGSIDLIYQTCLNWMDGVFEIRSLRIGAHYKNLSDSAMRDFSRAISSRDFWRSKQRALADSQYFLFLILIVGVPVWLNSYGGQMEWAKVIAFLVLAQRAQVQIANGINAWSGTLQAIPVFEKLELFILKKSEASVDAANTATSIKIDNVSFSYGEESEVLSEIRLNINRGEWVGLFGPNGAGKTTLGLIAAGVLTPRSGKVSRPSGELPAGAVYLGHDPSFCRENILDAVLSSRAINLDAAREVLVDCGLAGVDEKACAQELSAGQKQRLALARALVANPRALILDEAVSHLPARDQREFLSCLRSRPMAVLLITHDPALLDLADRVYRIEKGQLIPMVNESVTLTGEM